MAAQTQLAPTPPPFEKIKTWRATKILMDPPWQYDDAGIRGAAEGHYRTMSLDELGRLPVASLAAPDSILAMWTTWPILVEGGPMQLMKEYGFRPVGAAFVWAKLNRDGSPFTGLGHWTRGNTEPCLLGIRGAPDRAARDVQQLILAPRMIHSKKPKVHEKLDRLIPGPGIELFARGRDVPANWEVWGDQA